MQSFYIYVLFRGTIIHRKYFYGSVSLLPLTTAFTVRMYLICDSTPIQPFNPFPGHLFSPLWRHFM